MELETKDGLQPSYLYASSNLGHLTYSTTVILLFCRFVDFTKSFSTIPSAALWKRTDNFGLLTLIKVTVTQ